MKRMRRSNGRRWALLKRSVAYLACFLERKTKTWFKWGQLQDARASRLVSSLRSSKLYSEYEPNHSNWIKRSHESAGMRGGVQKESVVHTIIKGSINLFSLGKSEIKDRGLILKEPKLKIFCRRKCKDMLIRHLAATDHMAAMITVVSMIFFQVYHIMFQSSNCFLQKILQYLE